MGLFSKKPDRETQAQIVKQGTSATAWFGYARLYKKTNPLGQEDTALELTIKKNRDAIRDAVVSLVREYDLAGCSEGEIGGERLVPLAKQSIHSPLEFAALCTVFAINSINLITRIYYEKFPSYKPLHEAVEGFAKICCTGAAQMIGEELPPEVVETWPYFSRIFADAKRADLLPDLES